jgi:natural product precursor
MKKIKLNLSKLQLNKERILSLTDQDMEMVKGGGNPDQCTVQRPQATATCPKPEPIKYSDGCGIFGPEG